MEKLLILNIIILFTVLLTILQVSFCKSISSTNSTKMSPEYTFEELRKIGEDTSTSDLEVLKTKIVKNTNLFVTDFKDIPKDMDYLSEEAPIIYVAGMIKDNTKQIEIFLHSLSIEIKNTIKNNGLNHRDWDKSRTEDQVLNKKISLYNIMYFALMKFSYNDKNYSLCFKYIEEIINSNINPTRYRGIKFLKLLICEANYKNDNIINTLNQIILEENNRMDHSRDDLLSSKFYSKRIISDIKKIKECLNN